MAKNFFATISDDDFLSHPKITPIYEQFLGGLGL